MAGAVTLVRARQQRRNVVGVCMSGFVLVGLLSALLGPSLAVLSVQVGEPVARLGIVFTLDAFGSVCGSLLAALCARHVTVRTQGVLGCVGITLASLAVPRMGTLVLLCAAFFCLGLSKTFLIVTVNTLLIRGQGKAAGRLISVADFLLGVGSLLMPIVIAQFLILGQGLSVSYLVTTAAAAALGAGFLRLPRARLDRGSQRESQSEHEGPQPSLRQSVVVTATVALLLFFYVGFEASLSGWLPTYVADRELVTSVAAAGVFTSIFWASVTVGRILWIPVISRLAPTTVLLCAVGPGIVGATLLLLGTGSVAATAIGVIAIGLALAPVFPSAFVILSSKTGMAGWVSASALASASVGAMTFPLLASRLFA